MSAEPLSCTPRSPNEHKSSLVASGLNRLHGSPRRVAKASCCVWLRFCSKHAVSPTILLYCTRPIPACSLWYVHPAAFELCFAVVQSWIWYLIVLGVLKSVFSFFKLQPAFLI